MNAYKLEIRDYRKLKRLSQRELAAKIGISRSYLSELENQKYEITLTMLSKIANALQVHPFDLVEFLDNG